jgi:Uma2 family endonuclease
MREIYLPEAKPALEWVNGRVLQKVSPKPKHSLAQGRFCSALDRWASRTDNGMVGPEWRFQIAPPGEIRRTLVPDVAYVSFERISRDEILGPNATRVAPDVAVEILSPGDRQRDFDEKVRVYLAAGTSVVFIVDTKVRTILAKDAQGSRLFSDGEIVTHDALPGFSLTARTLFEI